ncbi:oligosaccharide transporter (flippase) [Paenibacillus marchantiophytorum]|uniref:Oligosaccharide transporter (Flippase) n=1 Tax=Paenibacillus marchantiophytorum TaxID=1619310 RepID=A0ABQ2BTW7_9BACL|nr:oligosaccharide flippase family protein [Paenibacillus marchantiophytorum]GGI46076.1 oligosaccharide transporter (flippase) [Paenibacillus marchantiophytorum]
MRVKKASINVVVNLLTFILGLVPSFILRKVFLDTLGNELLGLTSLYTNIIGLLSIVELGIGSAIIYSLYKPFAEGDYVKVKGYLNYYAKLYKFVGFIILGLGLIMTFFLHFFVKDQVNLIDAQLYFLLFLVYTLTSYFFSYKLCILNVAQDGYKISIATTLSKLLISILQFMMLKFLPDLYVYLWIQIIINFLFYLFMNLYIDKKYPWIRKTRGHITTEERTSLVKNVKALFLHKIGGILVLGTDNLVISSFINLTVVGVFNSYSMIVGAAQGLISTSLSGVAASVGNLLVEGSKDVIYKVHRKLFFLSFWIVSFATISLINTIQQFVRLWLGDNQRLDNLTIILLLINFYFFLMRGSVERFKEGGGIYYQDRFAPLVEASINLIASIIFIQLIGLPGVLLGTLLSNVTVIFWIKPKMVYKYIFEKKLREYFKMYVKFLVIGLIPLIITYLLTSQLKHINSVYALAANCMVHIIVINLIYYILFRKNEEFIYFKGLLLTLLGKMKFKWGTLPMR